jgi:hypothetical protein
VPAVRVTMRGRLLVGRWLPFTAVEVLHPLRGFRWAARVAGGVVGGSDGYLAREGSMLWKLFGLATVVQATGPDVSRSAAARAGAEGLWSPVALLPRYGVAWEATGPSAATARFAVGDTPIGLEVAVDGAGRPTSVLLDRWGDPDRTGTWGWHPFGGELGGHRRFGGVTVPGTGRLGWHWGTPRWAEGEFFRYELTGWEPLPEVLGAR